MESVWCFGSDWCCVDSCKASRTEGDERLSGGTVLELEMWGTDREGCGEKVGSERASEDRWDLVRWGRGDDILTVLSCRRVVKWKLL